jgi:hypothetical protein
METRNLEEILEECLSAHLEGRRSIEESLSLYPWAAEELAPLLRTAAEVSSGLDFYKPSEDFREELRSRLLGRAAERRRERLAKAKPRWTWRLGDLRWGFAAAGAAAALAVLIFASATIFRDGGGEPGAMANPPTPTPDAPAVANVSAWIEDAQFQVADLKQVITLGEPINLASIDEIRRKDQEIADDLGGGLAYELDEGRALRQLIEEQVIVLSQVPLDGEDAEDLATAIDGALAAANGVLAILPPGLVADPPAGGTPATEPEPTPAEPTPVEPTPVEPTETPLTVPPSPPTSPQPLPTDPPTPTPTPTPTSTPTPTPTPQRTSLPESEPTPTPVPES